MRFKNISLLNIDLELGNGAPDGNFEVPATDELIDVVNAMRRRAGNIDIVTSEHKNDVYYNFYLYFNPIEKEINLFAICNHGKLDDYKQYDIQLFPDEERELLYKIIEALVGEFD